MKLTPFLLFTLLCLCLCQCSKDDDPVNNEPIIEISDYVPLGIGNYWIYESVLVKPDGTEQNLNKVDSIYIANDTIINGSNYMVFKGLEQLTYLPFQASIVRDSSGSLVNSEGNILFSSNDFDIDIATNDSYSASGNLIFEESYQMKMVEDNITVSAGEFAVIDYRGRITFDPDRVPSGVSNPRTVHNYYSSGAGLVLQTYVFPNSANETQRRLLRYQTN